MRRPNLLFIHTDQQARWSVGAHGGTEVPTPHMDRLAAEGVLFERCHTVSAVCTPSRGCLLTGLYPHHHGAVVNNRPLDADSITWAEMLRRDGYRTGYIGKWHLDGERRPGFVHAARGFGFTDTRYMFNRGHWKQIVDRSKQDEPQCRHEVPDQAASFTTDYLTSKTLDFIQEAGDAPFAVMLSIPDPHTPFSVREPYASRFKTQDMQIPDSWGDAGQPSWARSQRGERNADNLARYRQDRAAYLGMVACIDENVGRLLDHLDHSGLAANTLVVFTSDHGEYMGEHGLNGKNRLYRSAYEVPCLWRCPACLPAGTRISQMITQNDFAATLCSVLQVAAPPRHVGRDCSVLWRDPAVHWRNEVYQHHTSGRLVGLLQKDWHLIIDKDGEHRLFDLVNDPDERQDRFADVACRPVVDRMIEKLRAHHEDVGSPCAAWLRGLPVCSAVSEVLTAST